MRDYSSDTGTPRPPENGATQNFASGLMIFSESLADNSLGTCLEEHRVGLDKLKTLFAHTLFSDPVSQFAICVLGKDFSTIGLSASCPTTGRAAFGRIVRRIAVSIARPRAGSGGRRRAYRRGECWPGPDLGVDWHLLNRKNLTLRPGVCFLHICCVWPICEGIW